MSTRERIDSALPWIGAALFPVMALGWWLLTQADEAASDDLDALAVTCGVGGILVAVIGMAGEALLIAEAFK